MQPSCDARRGSVGLNVCIGLVATVACVLSVLSLQQSRSAIRELASIEQAQQQFRPRVGQAMLLVQQHFVQAHFAGQAKNWDLAAHELDEIEGSLLLASHAIDAEDSLKFSEQMKVFLAGPLKQLHAAAEAKDANAWESSIIATATGCNACHAVFDHGYVRVKVPTQSGSALDFGAN